MSDSVLLQPGSRVPSNSIGFPHADTFLLEGQACPGKAELTSCGSPRAWDERQGYAQSGATLVPAGDHLSKIVFRVSLWDPSDWTLYQSFAAKFLAKSVRFKAGTTQPRALGIYHPVLAAPPHKITEVVIEDVSAPVQDADGMWTLEIHFIEYRKAKLAPAKPDAAPGAAQTAAPTALDKQRAETVALTNQLNNAIAGNR